MGFGLALYIQTDTDSYLQLPISALLFHSTSFKFSVLDSVTCEGHLCEEIHKVCPSSVNLTVDDCMSGFIGKFYLENT